MRNNNGMVIGSHNGLVIGSHNSMSYLPLKHWWQKPLRIFARCQSMTLQEQYDAGVRLFDIRVRYSKSDGRMIFCHNMVIYDYSVEDFVSDLERFEEPVYIRFILDIRKKPKNAEENLNSFLSFLFKLTHRFKEKVIINEALVFWERKDYAPSRHLFYSGSYSSISETFYRFLPPCCFAKVYNKQLKNLPLSSDDGRDCLLIDFVNLYLK